MFEAGYGISTISYNLQRSEVAIYQQIEKQDLYCDKTRLNQVLLNFLSNAIKFTPAGGTVSVRLRQLPGTRKDREQYEIRVKDNGIGMSPKFAKKIFDPFERERSSTVSQIQGTGLGMAITKNIVDMMGGVITLQSQLGKGTRFEVVLDFKICEETVQAAPAVCPAPAQDSPSLHGMRFLCSASATNRLRSNRNNRQHKSPAAENQAAGLSVCSPVRQGPAGSLQSRPG